MRLPTFLLFAALVFPIGACSQLDNLNGGGPSAEVVESSEDNRDTDFVEAEGPCLSFEGVEPGSRCSECGFGPVCGTPITAACQSRDNGQACQTCTTADGAVVFDSCLSSPQLTQAVWCESAPSQFDVIAGVRCSNCYSDDGLLVSSSCQPASESCSAFSVGSSQCEECSRDGVVVATRCTVVDEPRQCSTYSNDYGSCVECTNDDGVTIVQACSPVDAPPTGCTEAVGVNGTACQTCTSAGGEIVSLSCTDLASAAATCSILEFAEQTCMVCEAGGRPLAVVCERNGCIRDECVFDDDCDVGSVCVDFACTQGADYTDPDGDGMVDAPPSPEFGSSCAPPPGCSMSVNEQGEFCRTCPQDSGGEEVACVHRSPLSCEVVSAATAGITIPDGESDAVNALCQVCSDLQTLSVVWTNCSADDSNTPAPPCIHWDEEDCDVCFEWATGEAIYSSCADETCYNSVTLPLEDASGPVLLGDAPAIVDCVTCDDRTEGGEVVRCYLIGFCNSEDRVAEAEMEVWVADECAAAFEVTVIPKQCGNAWDGMTPWQSVESELAGMVAFGLANNVVIVQATQNGEPGDCGVCDCDRGDTLTLWVEADAVDQASRLFGVAGQTP